VKRLWASAQSRRPVSYSNLGEDKSRCTLAVDDEPDVVLHSRSDRRKSLTHIANEGPDGPIHYLEATALAALIRTKQLSSREVVQAHLDRVEVVNPKINAVVTLMAEAALKGADVADKAVASGAALGPLHGVPFSEGRDGCHAVQGRRRHSSDEDQHY
jgi:hypothetical protein